MIFFVRISLITFSSYVALRSRWVSVSVIIRIICIWTWVCLSDEVVNNIFKSFRRVYFSSTNSIVIWSQFNLNSLRLFKFTQITLRIVRALPRMLFVVFVFKFNLGLHLLLGICRVFTIGGYLIHNIIIAHLSIWHGPILLLSLLVFWQVREIPVLLGNFGLIVLHFSRKIWMLRIYFNKSVFLKSNNI